MLVLLSVGPPVDKPLHLVAKSFHTYETTILGPPTAREWNATYLIHEFKVANTCKPAITALTGFHTGCTWQTIETYVDVMI